MCLNKVHFQCLQDLPYSLMFVVFDISLYGLLSGVGSFLSFFLPINVSMAGVLYTMVSWIKYSNIARSYSRGYKL